MPEQDSEEFWKLSDQFINLANDLYEKTGDGRVGYALMYAAARFNAFIVASTAGDRGALADEKEEATEYFSGQYRKMFGENLTDYEENFDRYL
ncbi:MAG: DUF3144 domain-containing protein [Gammaproteobacteria bacterium]|nr:DUF3144 domain-containing protein [Gammaproteobacteria bacterium]MXY65666.1 DUF3144 domain-containing protein [Gammaproteobacteria bacterium]MYG67379.1 DUF3144 domain-containing protein [Gammaproteobacteria bacterium]